MGDDSRGCFDRVPKGSAMRAIPVRRGARATAPLGDSFYEDVALATPSS